MRLITGILLFISVAVNGQFNAPLLIGKSDGIPTNGLVAYYPFNGNANDESGNGNDGTVDGATLTTDRDGNTNSAYNFDGINDNISISDSDELSLSQFTISAWVDMNNKTSFKIIGKGVDFSNGEYTFGSTGNNEISIILIDSINGGFRGIKSFFSTGWLHLVATYDGTVGTNAQNGLKLYQNNILLSTTDLTSGVFQEMRNTINSVLIGLYNGIYANGKIDDVRIYNRVLTTDEITALYNE